MTLAEPSRRLPGQAAGGRNRLQGKGINEDAPLTQCNDEQLAAAILGKQVAALAEAYDRHGKVVYGFARGWWDQGQAEEVTRRVFLALWRSPGDFDPWLGSLRPPLLADAHRRVVRLLRAANSPRPGDAEGEPALQVTRPGPDALNAAAASRLVEPERTALYLAYFQGFDYQQIAALTEQSAAAVATSLRRGLRNVASHGGVS